MFDGIAEQIWPSVFEAILQYWRANAPRLTKERMRPDLLEDLIDAAGPEVLSEDEPVLSNEGQLCIRAREGGSFECWCATVGEHPIGIKVFVRLELTGEWHADGTATWNVHAPPGDGSEGGAADPIVDAWQAQEAEGFASFTMHKGRVLAEE